MTCRSSIPARWWSKARPSPRCTTTGIRTEMGKIGKALQVLQPEETNLQQQTGRIVKTFALIGLALCVMVVVVFGLHAG